MHSAASLLAVLAVVAAAATASPTPSGGFSGGHPGFGYFGSPTGFSNYGVGVGRGGFGGIGGFGSFTAFTSDFAAAKIREHELAIKELTAFKRRREVEDEQFIKKKDVRARDAEKATVADHRAEVRDTGRGVFI